MSFTGLLHLREMGAVLINWKRDKRLVFTALDSTQYNMIVLGGCTGSDFTRVGVPCEITREFVF